MTTPSAAPLGLLALLRALLAIFQGRERWILYIVVSLSMVAAVAETLSVAVIYPFMTVVVDPGAIQRWGAVTRVLSWIGVSSQRDSVVALGIFTILALVIGNSIAAFNIWVQERFSARAKTRLSTQLFSAYLHQPYAFHVQRDAPSLIKVVTVDVLIVVNGVIGPILVVASRGFVALGILTLLFVQEPTVALSVGVVLSVAYGLVFLMTARIQRGLGARYSVLNLVRQRVVQEALGGVKELQVLGRQGTAVGNYAKWSREWSLAEASNRTVAQYPRYLLEALAFGGIVLIVLLQPAAGGTQSIVPLLALYAFAGNRLLPALQLVYGAAMNIRFSLPTFRDALMADLHLPVGPKPAPAGHAVRTGLPLKSIHVRDLSFTYPGGARPTLDGINVVLEGNESVGIVGRTGSGKTTLADVILGIYEPTAGSIVVDGVPLDHSNLRDWRRRVGYVPQHVFLANASIAENIAFGLPPAEIDHAAVRKAARLAQAEEFITALPRGFDAIVGERGVKLSGGQRQRLGIARALYGEPELLVFDEATSALDGLTEDAVMEAIRSLRGERTIILIAHRLRTVEACDQVVMLEQGRIVAQGSYASLVGSSEVFSRFVGAGVAEASARQP